MILYDHVSLFLQFNFLFFKIRKFFDMISLVYTMQFNQLLIALPTVHF